MTRPRVTIEAFRGRISQTYALALPRYRKRPELGEQGGESVFAFPMRRAPMVLVISVGGWCMLDSAEFATDYYPSNRPAKEAWGRHYNKWLKEQAA